MTALYYETSNELYHHGVKGMKWGRRRYQNEDGSLTPAGIKRYATKGYAQDSYNSNKTKLGKAYDRVTDAHKYAGNAMYGASSNKQNKARAEQYVKDEQARKEARNTPEAKAERRKKAIKVGAAVAGTALAAYGAKKVHDYIRDENTKVRMKQAEEYFNRERDRYFESNFESHNLRMRGLIDDKTYVHRLESNADAIRSAGSKSRDMLDIAKTDSFKTAAKNVIDDRRKRR